MASFWFPFPVFLPSSSESIPLKVRLPSFLPKKPVYVRLIKLDVFFVTEVYLLADSIPIVLELIRNITPVL